MRGGAVLDITLNAIEEAFAAKLAARQQQKEDEMIDDKSDAGSWAEALAFKDAINPDHYKVGGIETIGYLQAKLSPEEFAGYCRGNALKYLSRAGHKDDAAQDYRKAKWYIERLISCLDTEPAP
jgi:hypothetical protein